MYAPLALSIEPIERFVVTLYVIVPNPPPALKARVPRGATLVAVGLMVTGGAMETSIVPILPSESVACTVSCTPVTPPAV